MIHTFNALNVYAGMSVAFMYRLISLDIIIMSIVSIVIIVLETKRHKFLKQNLKNINNAKLFAAKKYQIELYILIGAYVFVSI